MYNSLFLFIACCYALSSCSIAKKEKDKRIVGAWNIVDVMNIAPTETEQWIFDETGKVFRMKLKTTGDSILDVGDWVIEQKISTAYINIAFGTTASQQEGLSVLWEILTLKKTTMILTNQDGGLLIREFEKVF